MEYMDDEVAGATNELQSADARTNFEVKSSLKSVEVPMKGGSPAFSIHADKVYILYPSLFQDPNIFGRFSIPQNINLDPVPEKTVTKTKDPAVQPKPIMMNPGNYNANERKISKRQADEAPSQKAPSKRETDKKRNVETHLTGTIVVLNQDVNEVNQKDSY